MSNEQQPTGLKKSLKLLHVWAIAAGAIFCYLGYYDQFFVGYCGSGTFFAFFLMAVAVLFIAMVYCELAPMFPHSGAELIYNTVGMNKHMGFFSAWIILAAWIAVPPTACMIIVSWINHVFGFNGSLTQLIVISIICMCIYFVLSLMDIQVAGNIQTVMLSIAIGGSILTGVLFIFSGHWDWSNITRDFFSTSLESVNGIPGWLIGMALLITPYFGFECVPQLVEDGDFPVKESTKAILMSVVSCSLCYIFFFFCLAGISDWKEISQIGDFMTIKFIRDTLGWHFWTIIFGIISIICAIGTCLLGFWISTVRMIYAMGEHNFLPKAFAKVNKHHQPILPNILCLVIGIFFLIMLNISTVMADFFNLMSFGCSIAYAVTVISAMRIAKKHPDWLIYKIPGGKFTRIMALIISLIIAYFCTLGQSTGSWICLGAYCGVGVVIWLWMVLFRWKKEKVVITTLDGDKEY